MTLSDVGIPSMIEQLPKVQLYPLAEPLSLRAIVSGSHNVIGILSRLSIETLEQLAHRSLGSNRT